MPTKTRKITPSSVASSDNAKLFLYAAWVIGLGSSAVMAYFEYYAITADVDYSHDSLLGYPGYCLALIITTILAFLYARKARGKTWTLATVLLTIWTLIAILSTIFVTNSTS